MPRLPQFGEIHPAFHSTLTQIIWAKRILGVLMILFAGVPLIVMPQFLDDPGFYVLFLVIPLAVAYGVTLFILGHLAARPLVRASGLMHDMQPVHMRMLPLGVSLKSRGKEKAALFLPADPQGALPRKTVWIKTPSDGALDKRPVAVRVYEDRFSRDRFTVIRADEYIVWGRMEPD